MCNVPENETRSEFVAVRLSVEDATALRALARYEERSVSSLVRVAIRRLLTEQKEKHGS